MQPDYPEARLMFMLERKFLALAGREGDDQTTRLVVDALAPLYGDDTPEVIETKLAEFVANHGDNLRFVYAHNREHPSHPFVMQPASLMIFERLVADRFGLKDRWVEAGLPLAVLERLSTTYGHPITV